MGQPATWRGAYRSMLDRLYETASVPIQLTSGKDESRITLQAIDRTIGIEVKERGLDIASVRPVIAVRSSELTAQGIEPQDLIGGIFALNGVNWRIQASVPKPGPFGQTSDQTFFVLLAV